MIVPARLLAPRVKIKVHLRATRKSGAQSAISGKAQDSLGSASQIRLRFIRTKQIETQEGKMLDKKLQRSRSP
jgi:hypothetical protein